MFKAAMFAVSVAGMGLTGAVALGGGDSESAPLPIDAFALEAAVAEAPEMGWHLLHEGDRAKLAYGVANSDQIAVILTCAPGDRTVDIYGVVQPDTTGLTLASGGHAATLDGAPEVDPLTGAMAVETQAPLSDPVLAGFQRGEGLSVVGRGSRRVLDASAEERRLVDAFFGHCSQART